MKKKIIYIIFTLIFLFVLNTCGNTNKKPTIPIEYYNIEIEIKNGLYRYMNHAPYYDTKCEYKRWYYEYSSKFMFTQDSLKHYFTGGGIEIEFESLKIPLSCFFIKMKFSFSEYKDYAFYIHWKNRPYDTSMKSLYKWEIGEYTDTIYSNLDEKIIKEIYPNFKGKYINKQLRKIVLDRKYKTYDIRFYENIILEGLDNESPNLQTNDTIPDVNL